MQLATRSVTIGRSDVGNWSIHVELFKLLYIRIKAIYFVKTCKIYVKYTVISVVKMISFCSVLSRLNIFDFWHHFS